MASAFILPIWVSPFDEMVPTCATSADEPTFFARFSMSFTTAATAMSMPRLRSIGFMPAATDLAPSFTIAWASTVAVVVPSPAVSLLFWATSRTIWAPMFSNLSSSSISFATVTPSLVIRGAPKLLSSTTLRPLGPSVTFTALARMSTPRSILSRASPPNRTSFAAISTHSIHICCIRVGCVLCDPHPEERRNGASRRMRPVMSVPPVLRDAGFARSSGRGSRSGNDAHDVGLLHDQEILAVEHDLGARPLAEQNLVAGLHVRGDDLAGLVAAAGADGDDLALRRLLLGGVGGGGGPLRLFLGIDTLHDHPVVQGTELGLGHIGCPYRCWLMRLSG